MRPVRRFEVTPAIPPALAALPDIASNLHWSWDPEATRLFARLWPGWRPGQAHPAEMVRTTPAERLAELAADPGIVNDVGAVSRRLQTALKGTTWFGSREDSPLHLVAYFSPEFGISEALPQYSGGLGVLAGDHLKASSDLGVPLVGIGLLYTEGYFRQRLDADGWQQQSVADFTPQSLGLLDTGVEVTVDLAGDPVRCHVWRADVGRIPLYLLDTDVEGNSPDGVAVTDRLYGGDEHHRLRQEIVLGIGGVRAIRALGLEPDVFHTNEGHAGFLGLERIRELVVSGLPFAAAIEATRGGGVFTTHTPVPAGIDRFPRALLADYFTDFAKECGVTFDELFDIGRRADEPDDKFNMAVMGLRLAARSNGVARLHGSVSRRMFNGMWPDLAVDDVPIGSITNGVHGRTWASARVDALLTRVVGEDWPGADATRWARVRDVDALEAWTALNDGRDELVRLARQRLGEDVLDPTVLTVGFARRFATYKRATLLLSDRERLCELLLDRDRPVQFVFAGKAHPADTPGKELIQQIEQFARSAEVRHRFVFLADYDISIARTMYHGCDVWLNTPRRPLEACGTSGMKAALNGALNCSILDGWWDECYDGTNGWAIESADDDPDLDRRDLREVGSLFAILETPGGPEVLRPGPRWRARGSGCRWCCRRGRRSARRSPRRGWCATTRRRCTSRRRRPHGTSPPTAPPRRSPWRTGGGGWTRVGRRSPSRPSSSTTARHRPARPAPSRSPSSSASSPSTTCGWKPCTDYSATTVSSASPSRSPGCNRQAAACSRARSPSAWPGSYGVSACAFPVHRDLASPFDVGRVAWAE